MVHHQKNSLFRLLYIGTLSEFLKEIHMERKTDMDTFLKRLKLMTPMNNLMMSAMFDSNRRLTEDFLRSILKFDLEVVRVDSLRTLPGVMLGKSPQLDVLARLADGSYVNIEVQIKDEGTDPKRLRYYKARLDTNQLTAGDDYSFLSDVYVIMITENDIFKKGLMVYPFEWQMAGADLSLDIGEHIIYINRSAEYDSSRLADFLHDFGCSDPSDMRITAMRDASMFYKNTEKGVKIMYDRYNEVYAEGMNEGLKIGRTEGIEIGKSEGIEIGRSEGIEIGRKQAEMETSVRMSVSNIRKYGESVSQAAASVGMSEDEFRKEAQRLGFEL